MLVLCGAATRGQTALFLEPSVSRVAVGEGIRLGLSARAVGGDGPAEPTAWPAEIAWFFVRSGGAQDNRDRVEPVADGDASHVPITLASAGCAMLAVDFKPEVVTLTGEQFASLLAARTRIGPDAALRAREQVRVRHVRSAKALVRVTGETGPIDASTAVSKSGQAVEIRPFADPTLLPSPGNMPLRMYVGGDASGTPRLRAVHAATGEARDVAAQGTATLPILGPGTCRVEFHHAAPLVGDPEADWVLYTATLVFEAPAAGQEAGR